jgi:hypothetical protein
MRWFIAFGFDAMAVIVFVIIGRSSHDGQSTIAGVASAAAPFLIALVAAWLIVRAWESPPSWPAGIGVWVITTTGGMLLRRFVFDDGTTAGFIVVGSVLLGVFLLGWRALTLWIRSGRPGPAAGAPTRDDCRVDDLR